MQTRGGFVKQKQHAFFGQTLLAAGFGFGRFRQETRQLQALRLATAQGGHGLAKFDVIQAHIDDGLQGTHHIAVVGKQLNRFAHRQIEHLGHVEQAPPHLRCCAIDFDFQNFRAIALPVAVLAAQVHIAQKLHFHVLKTRAAAGGAASIAAVETEFRSGVAPLLRHGLHRKYFANRIPRPDVTDGIGTRGFANRRLIDKHHIAQMISAQQAIVRAGCFCSAAKVTHQRRRQHILDQARFARPTHASDADQALQGKFDVQVFQVVLARAFQNQPWRVVRHRTFEAQANGFAGAQIRAGQGVGGAQIIGRSVKHNLAAAHAGPRAHVQNSVGAQHDGGIVLDHHQGVARIAQAQHGLVDAVHVARVQPNAGLIQHKQGIDQRGAQGRGEVDALHLTAAQGAALPIQGEVANAHIVEVFQACANFIGQQHQRLRIGASGFDVQGIEKLRQLADGQQHQIVQTQARHGLQLLTRPSHTLWHETFGRRQHGVGLFCVTDSPQQAFGFQPRASTNPARRVAAVFGQQHTDVHFVRLALQVFKESFDAVPLLIPLALPQGRAFDDPVFLCLGEFVPRCVTRHAFGFGVAHQVVLALFPSGGLDGFDGARTQSEFVVGNHQAVIHPNHTPKPTAGVARPNGRVERKHGRDGVAVTQIAVGTMQAG